MAGSGASSPVLPSQLVTRRDLLAITAVVDIALHGRSHPVAASALAERQRLSARHLEPLLQAMVRHGILKGVRGPHGGYELACDCRDISVGDVLRVVRLHEVGGPHAPVRSPLLKNIVAPAMAEAEQAFAAVVSTLTLDDLVRRAADEDDEASAAFDFTT